MDDVTAKKFYGMYDNEEYVPEIDYKPNINTTPQIEVDNRTYTRNAEKKVTQPNNITNNTTPNNVPNTNNPQYSPIKISGRKFLINGKPIEDFIKEVVYYNPNDPLDPGNYVDLLTVGALASDKYGKSTLEKILIVAGITAAGVKAKDYLYEKFVK